jgi:hypothetical protein
MVERSEASQDDLPPEPAGDRPVFKRAVAPALLALVAAFAGIVWAQSRAPQPSSFSASAPFASR